jgi:hypothetical protein
MHAYIVLHINISIHSLMLGSLSGIVGRNDLERCNPVLFVILSWNLPGEFVENRENLQ